VEVIHRLKLPALDGSRIMHRFAGPIELISKLILASWVAVFLLALLVWTFAGISKMFIPADEGSALAAFDPIYAVPLYLALFAALAIYHRSETHDVHDELLQFTKKTFSRRRLRRAGIMIAAAGIITVSILAAAAAAPHLASLIARFAAYTVARFSPAPTPPLPPPTLEPWEADMDFVFFAPTGSEEKAMTSAMEDSRAFGAYSPDAYGQEEGSGGVRWGDLLRIGVVLVMGPAGAVALRRRTW
jgi:hypothetical protein